MEVLHSSIWAVTSPAAPPCTGTKALMGRASSAQVCPFHISMHLSPLLPACCAVRDGDFPIGTHPLGHMHRSTFFRMFLQPRSFSGSQCSDLRMHGHAGDTMQPVADKRWVTFMLSFSNYLPLPAAEVSRIGRTVTAWPFDFDRIYGGWWGQVCRLLLLSQTSAICSASKYVSASK